MIYFDNAATSYPKPSQVRTAVNDAFIYCGANPGRGVYPMSKETTAAVSAGRGKLAAFLNCPCGERLVFTSGATESLNVAIHGLLKKGDHVIYSGMEHNAVWRPLKKLEAQGVITTAMAEADSFGRVSPGSFEAALKKETALIVCLHASNVTGGIMPVEDIGRMAKRRGIPFLVDASQSAGALLVDTQAMGISLLALAGHKGLYGPMGTGCLYIDSQIQLDTIKEGGTGSLSELWEQPEFYPDRLESGTLNVPGIIGLSAGVDYINARGIESIYCRNRELTECFLEGLSSSFMTGITVYGPPRREERLPVIMLNVEGWEPQEAAKILAEDYHLAVRAGYHCTPLAHLAIGTGEAGGIRFSMNDLTTFEDVETALRALCEISRLS